MSRRDAQEASAVGHDSFLDVVTNIVGILIVLVMVVGMRIKNAPVEFTPDPQMREASAALDKRQAAEQSLYRELTDTTQQVQTVAAEAARRQQERDLLATLAAAAEHKLRSERENLDAGSKEEFDASKGVSEARNKLNRVKQMIDAAAQSPAEPEIVRSYPTPLAKLVTGDEVHFQLRNGRVAFVPLEKLLLLARSDARAKADKLLGDKRLPEFTETVGPEGGFRFRYTAESEEKTERTPNGLARVAYLRITQWTVIPVSGELGEPVGEALSSDSEFRKVLRGLRPGETTVTLWAYEDSFDASRQLRGELYRLGFPAAVRPLPDGVMIGGSPRGSKSESQ